MGGGYQQSSGSSNQKSSSSNASTGMSQSTSAPQLTPSQLVSLYSTALPSINSVTQSTTNANNPALAAANRGAVAGVNAINLNGLSPGEANSVERSTNQGNVATGNLGLINGTNTTANALNFGGAFNNKVNLLNNATQTASGAAGANAGALNATSNLFSPIASNATAQNSKSTSSLQSVGSSMGVGNSSNQSDGGNVSFCCFIFLESYHGTMPVWVRKCRDVYYRKYPEIASGYISMAKWLVPLMKRSSIIRSLVWNLMVYPLTEHGYSIRFNDKRFKHSFARRFWFSTWHLIGRLYGN